MPDDGNTKIQLIPDNWIWTTIGEITQPIQKVNPREAPELEFIYLDISSIDNEKNVVTSPKTYLGADAPSRARQLVKAGDVVFSTVRTYLRNIARVPDQFDGQIASTGFSILRPEAGIEGRYLFYYTLTDNFINELSEMQRGTSYPAVRDSDVREQRIPLAPEKEQERIVSEIEKQFTRLDAGIANLKQVQANLERYKASVLKAACEGRLVPQDPSDEPAERLLARILAERRRKWEQQEWQKLVEMAKQNVAQAKRKAAGLSHNLRDLEPEDWQDIPKEAYRPYLPKSDKWKKNYKEPEPVDPSGLPALPTGWVWARFLQIGLLGRGKSKHRPRNDPLLYGGDFPFIQTGDIRVAEGYLTGYSQTYNERGLAQSRLWPKGTLCITIAANIAETAILGIDACFPDSVVGFIGDSDSCDMRYIEYFMRTAKARLDEFAPATAQKNINLQTLDALSIPLPPIAEQKRIAEELESRLSIARSIEKSLEYNVFRSDRVRQSILQKAFSGQLLSSNPNDESIQAFAVGNSDQPSEKLWVSKGDSLDSGKAKQMDLFLNSSMEESEL